MIDAGTHRARAVNAELGLTKNGGETIGIEYELLDLPGQRITYYGYFTDKSTHITTKAMRTSGFRGGDVLNLGSLQGGDTPEVDLVVEHEEWPEGSGDWRAKVKWVNSRGGVSMKTSLDGAAAKVFAAKMRGAFAAHDAGSGEAPPQEPRNAPRGRTAPAPLANDDIPF